MRTEQEYREEAKSISHRRLTRRPYTTMSKDRFAEVEKLLKEDGARKDVSDEEKIQFAHAVIFGWFEESDARALQKAEALRQKRTHKASWKTISDDWKDPEKKLGGGEQTNPGPRSKRAEKRREYRASWKRA